MRQLCLLDKAVITARMLSGRYPTDKLQRHWTQNKDGKCLLPNCSPPSEGSLEHLLLNCSSLASTRSKLLCLLFSVAEEHIVLGDVREVMQGAGVVGGGQGPDLFVFLADMNNLILSFLLLLK